jgi:hypothetical protein
MSASIKPTAVPSTFGAFDKFGGCPTECSTGFGGFGAAPSTFGGFGGFGGAPSTFGGFCAPTNFGGFGGNYPAEWSRFGGFGGNYPAEWSRFGGFPSTFGGFGGNVPAEWSRFGGNFPAEWSRFGGYPWGTESNLTTPYSRWGSTGVPSSWSANEWTNFEKTFFHDFERSMKTVERELDTLRRIFDYSNKTTNKDTTAKSYSTSMVQLPSRPTSSLEYYTFQNPIKYDTEGNRWLCLCFDLPSFKPEEIKVTLYAKANPAYIEIIANHDVKDVKEHAIKRTYERKYFFPADMCLKSEDIAKLEIKSHFSNDGCLYIEAILPRLTAELAAKERTHYPTWSVPVKTEKKDL